MVNMHIPDGFLDTTTSVTTWAASAGIVGYAVRRAGKELEERGVPLIGVTGDFVFAAQMMSFTVAGGTSGHLLAEHWQPFCWGLGLACWC